MGNKLLECAGLEDAERNLKSDGSTMVGRKADFGGFAQGEGEGLNFRGEGRGDTFNLPDYDVRVTGL